jgi:hypothetical protein
MQGPASGWARHGCTPSPSRDSLYHPEAASTTVADSSQSMPRRYCKKQQVLLSSVSPLHMGPAPCTPKKWDRSARRPILHRPSPRLPRLPPPSDQQFLQNPINRGGPPIQSSNSKPKPSRRPPRRGRREAAGSTVLPTPSTGRPPPNFGGSTSPSRAALYHLPSSGIHTVRLPTLR